jgi:hypothetical protein
MSNPGATSQTLCPECGAAVQPADSACWLCHRSLTVVAEVVETPVVPDWERQRRANPTQFSLESLMLVVTLVAVCLGMIMALPGLGILISIVAAPALVRTLIAGYQEKAAGGHLTLAEKVMAFIASTGVTLAVLVTGFAAFGAACFGSCLVMAGVASTGANRGVNGDTLIMALLGFSALVGLAAAIAMFWLLRPRRGK